VSAVAECLNCGREFVPRRPGHVFCRNRSRYAHRAAEAEAELHERERRELAESNKDTALVFGERGPFETEEERRAAWEERKDRLMRWPGAGPAWRPQPWWQYEAGRPHHVTSLPNGYGSNGRDLDAYKLEPLIWMAANGHLSDEELAGIRIHAEEAAERVGTGAELMSTRDVSSDRSAVRLARAVEATLAGEPLDWPDFGVSRE
jgi:hypothetical protein